MISDDKLQLVAEKIGIDVPTIKAVAEVESSGSGFLSTGEVKILFEPHLFWQQLIKHGIDPNQVLKEHPDFKTILYPKQGTYPYGKVSEQHVKLQKASTINREVALESASWGSFQILGKWWADLGYSSMQQFINSCYTELGQLEIFIRFLLKNKLIPYLKAKDWSGFALRYNGKAYKKFNYDTKLANAYKKYSK